MSSQPYRDPLALIIEDDKKLADIFSHALESAEYRTETVSDGQAALSRLNDVTPAVVVLDLHLPNISGDEILHHIRTEARFSKTRVMLATADALLAQNLIDLSDLVLLKPISFAQLRDLAQRLYPRESL